MYDTAHRFLEVAFKDILGACTDRKQSELRQKCEQIQKTLQDLNKAVQRKTKASTAALVPYQDPISIKSEGGDTVKSLEKQWDVLANLLVDTIQLACESKKDSIIEPALDCLQKLLIYGYVQVGTPDLTNGGSNGLMARITKIIASCLQSNSQNVEVQMIKAFTAAVTTPACAIHGSSLMEAINTVITIYLKGTSIGSRMARGMLSHTMDTLFVRIAPKEKPVEEAAAIKQTEKGSEHTEDSSNGKDKEKETDAEPEKDNEDKEKEASSSKPEGKTRTRTKSMVHKKDCALVFAHLCALSNPAANKSAEKDKDDIRSRLLALELIDFLLEGLWQGLEDNPRFVDEHIKKNLCISLSSNATHPNLQVFSYALSITLSLIKYFRHVLKEEIRVFLSVFLRILESNNSSIQQKSLVVDFIHKICQEPQILCDIFVNYDCDLDHGDVFDNIVNRLSKVVTVGTARVATDPMVGLQKRGLQALVSILNSIVDWSAELYEPPKLPEALRGAPSAGGSEQEEQAETANMEVKEEDIVDPAAKAVETDKWQQNKERKLLLDQGKKIFAMKAKKGIDFFQEHGFVSKSPESLAAFLMETPGLDKVQIGQYLGAPNCIPVLHAYVDNHFSFKGKELDVAMRRFLSCFWLPGEAMQIDRIMEKFAERYYRDNLKIDDSDGPQYFEHADSVFTLAFATIMLATDRHNPMIKDKIELEQWKHNLRGLNNEKNFDPQLLAEIFARIDAEPFQVTSDTMGENQGKNAFLNEKERQSAFLDEAGQMAEKAQALIKNALSSKSTYFKATNIQYVKPMFQVTWGALLAAFSLSLEHTQDPEIINLCLTGLRHSIRVSNIFYMETEQSAFISALTKFCHMTEEVEEKHLWAINTIIEIALEDGNYLRGCWEKVLRVLSQLDRMHEFASGISTNDLFDDPHAHKTETTSPVASSTDAKRAAEIYDYNARVITAQIPMSKIDAVFMISKELSNTGILDLVSGVCLVSAEEIQQEKPSLFSMKKMVELAVDNMRYRRRIVWNRVWKMLANHFTFAGCQKNRKIAIFAIDSLRLIAMKFLEFEELANYNFQNEFLKPFEEVAKTKSRAVREHVVECLCTMITALPQNIKSGWACILNVFASQASLSSNESVVKRSFEMTDQIAAHYFAFVANNYFNDLVHCLAAYASSKKDPELAVKAIKSFKLCAKKLTACKPDAADAESEEGPEGEVQRWHAQWLSLVNAFVKTILDATVDNRRIALNTLFSVLKAEGGNFDTSLWKYILEHGLWHLFDKLKNVTADTKEDWLLTESSDLFKALHGVISLFDTFFPVMHTLLADVLALMATFIESENEHLATFGTTSLETLLQNNGKNFSDQDWSQVTQSLKIVLRQPLIRTFPSLTVEPAPTGKKEKSSTPKTASPSVVMMKVVVGKCEVRKQLLHLVRDLILKSFYTCLSLSQIKELMECLQRTYDNATIALDDDSFFDKHLAGLDTRQFLLSEVTSDAMYCYFDFLFRLEEDQLPDRTEIAKNFLIKSCESLIQTYMSIVAQFVTDAADDEIKKKSSTRARLNPQSAASSSGLRYFALLYRLTGFSKKQRLSVAMSSAVPILVLILTKLLTYPDDKLSSVLPSIYPLLCDLILSDSYQVRLLVRQITWRVGLSHVPGFNVPFRQDLATGTKRFINSPQASPNPSSSQGLPRSLQRKKKEAASAEQTRTTTTSEAEPNVRVVLNMEQHKDEIPTEQPNESGSFAEKTEEEHKEPKNERAELEADSQSRKGESAPIRRSEAQEDDKSEALTEEADVKTETKADTEPEDAETAGTEPEQTEEIKTVSEPKTNEGSPKVETKAEQETIEAATDEVKPTETEPKSKPSEQNQVNEATTETEGEDSKP